VIRREFRQFEGSWYDGQKIKLSRDRVDRLGFLKKSLLKRLKWLEAPIRLMLIERR